MSKRQVKEVKKEIKKEVRKSNRRQRRRAGATTTIIRNPAGQKRNQLMQTKGGGRLMARNLDRQLVGGLKNGIGATLREEPSAAAWPKVYVNPFMTIDARLPIWPVRSTLCQFRSQTIKGQTNDKGNGWITFWPSNMIMNDVSYATFTNASTDANEIGPASGSAVCLGQFSSSSFHGDGSYSMRVVAWGFKIRYLGTELNKGGEVVCLQMMPRASMDTMTSTQMQAGYLEWKEGTFDNKYKMFTRLYTENDDGLYQNIVMEDSVPQWQYDDFGTTNSENFNYISAYITAAAINQPFEVQVAGHYEIIGPLNNQTGVTSTTLNTQKHEKTVSKVALQRTATNQFKPATSHWGDFAKVAEMVGAFL
jgi:hypothetical protein